MSRKKFTLSIAIVAVGIAGGSAAASDYPPDVAPTTVVTAVGGESGSVAAPTPGQSAEAQVESRAASLPSTGSDSADLIKIAGGVVIAGAGLVAVTRRRRHAPAA
jgi:LPXTG-motif cell wall-anchored protein